MITVNVFIKDKILTSLYVDSVPPFKKGEIFYFSGWMKGIESYVIKKVCYHVQHVSEIKNFLIVELYVNKE